MLLGPPERLTAAGLDADAVLAALLETDRAVVEGLAAPDIFRLGLDLTDSGPLPTTERGYKPAAVDALLEENSFNRLCVDFPLSRRPGCRWSGSSPGWCSASA